MPLDAVQALRDAVAWLVAELPKAPSQDLGQQAGPVTWTCWETVDHIGDCLLAYALQVTSGQRGSYLPLEGIDRGVDFIHFPVELGTGGVVTALPAVSELLVGAVLTAPAGRLSFHNYTDSDGSGFAAMGAVETLLHGHDVLTGLGADPVLPEGPTKVVLARLFPHVEPHDLGAGATLLWAAGRADLPGRAPVGENWRWDGSVLPSS